MSCGLNHDNDGLLKRLADIEGYPDDPFGVMEMLEDATYDRLMHPGVPAICRNEGCNYTTFMEPDQDKGWCEHCEENTVVSCLVLVGVI